MKAKESYIIPFKGLRLGTHEFTFQLKDEFLSEHELLKAESGLIDIFVHLDKKSRHLELEFELTGKIQIPCDRCLELFWFPIQERSRLIVYFKEQEPEYDDEIWVLNTNDYELDLYQFFYDCLGTALPITKAHTEEDIAKGICKSKVTPDTQNDDTEEMDPRWAALKQLKNKNK